MVEAVLIFFLIILVFATIFLYIKILLGIHKQKQLRKQAEFDAIIERLMKELYNNYTKAKQTPPQKPVLRPAPANAFKLLGLPITATEIQIKSQFKKLAMKHHPDKGGCKEFFQQIVDARELCIKYSSQKSSI